MSCTFSGCKSLKNLTLKFNTEKVVSMAKMFRGCINLEILNISSFTGESLEESDNMYEQCLNIHTIIYNSKYPEFEKNN